MLSIDFVALILSFNDLSISDMKFTRESYQSVRIHHYETYILLLEELVIDRWSFFDSEFFILTSIFYDT